MSVTIQGAVKRFEGRAAVDGVSVEIPDGAFFVALGPSGCGKSTLLRLIAGLETLDEGTIALDGKAVSGPGLHVAPEDRRVGVVFQSYALWPHLTVARNVAFPIEAAGVRRAQALAEAATHLRAVAMEDFADRLPAALSGGQRQRVALARCLASRAGTVLMDEPLANLDPHLRAAMEHELAAFHARAGLTTLYITHDQREAMALGTLVAVMREGRFDQVAPPETIHARPATEHVARFVGRGAVLDAEVLSVDGARALVRVAGAEAVMDCAPGARPGPARALVRPADVALGEGPLSGRTTAAAFRGEGWEVWLHIPGVAEPVLADAPRRLAPGEAAPLRLTGGWIIPTR
jgi:iron(III) transport system ATP-binding protein